MAASGLLAGCSESTAEADTDTDQLARVSWLTASGEVADPDDVETNSDAWESWVQLSLTLEQVAWDVTRVDATVVTDEGSQTATWLLPDQHDETRTLGSRSAYDEQDVVNIGSGDMLEVRAWIQGRAELVARHELLVDSEVEDAE